MDCSVDGCERAAARAGLCWGHIKRRQRGVDVHVTLRRKHPSRRDMVLEACHNLEDTDPADKDAWDRAWQRLRIAMFRYRQGRPYRVHNGAQTLHH